MYKEKCVVAVIVAAGKGTRLGGQIPKQFLMINDKYILEKTIERFEINNFVDSIVVVVGRGDLEFVKQNITYNKPIVSKVVSGGKERLNSVYNGIMAIGEEFYDSIVLIHDGVRPFASQKLINSTIEGAYNYGSCIPAIDLVDTVKQVTKNGIAKKTIDRSKYKAVQTPQAFIYDIIRECYEKAVSEEIKATDDSSVVENYGYKVKVIPGLEKNIKITTAFDLNIAEVIENMI